MLFSIKIINKGKNILVCQQKIKELELRMKRKLTPAERKAVEEKLHHNEIHEHEHEQEEAIVA